MENIFVMNSIETKLEYIKKFAPSIFERVRSELEEGDAAADVKNRWIISKAVFETFEISGEEALIADNYLYDVPAVLHYLTKGKTARIGGKYKIVDSACFAHCPSLETVIFDEGVEAIHERALRDNALVKTIVFPKSLKYIRDNAFRNCNNLGEVVFLNPETWVSPSAFEGTKWFSQFKQEFVVVNGQLLKYNGNNENVMIPEGIIHISNEVFCEKDNIKTVTCPTTLEIIWTCAFADCTNLQSVILNDNLKRICIGVFQGCTKLKEVNFPKSLEELGIIAFERDTVIHFHDINEELTEYIKKTYPNCLVIEE